VASRGDKVFQIPNNPFRTLNCTWVPNEGRGGIEGSLQTNKVVVCSVWYRINHQVCVTE